MNRIVVALALVTACRGDHHAARKDAGRDGPASGVSAVIPKLPISEDGVAELRALDKRIEIHRGEPAAEIEYLIERAHIRGRLEDYQDAMARSAALVEHTPADPAAWTLRIRVLSTVHEFAQARAAIEKLKPLVHYPADWEDLEASVDEATGHLERSAPVREAAAKTNPNPSTVTQWAASLALAGKLDAAIALIPDAASRVRDNPPALLSWLLFQWGRLYEQKADFAVARAFFEASRARLPGYLEATVHLAQTMIATGDAAGARKLAREALADNPHPELLALAGGVDAARREWERYVAALPKAFSDHAARFFLGPGGDPLRAFALAKDNLGNRDTLEARALVVETALAAREPADACKVVDPLISGATRAQRFFAWRALASCGRTAEAAALAQALGITPQPRRGRGYLGR